MNYVTGDLIDAVARHPGDHFPLSVLADHLEEHGHPLADLIRHVVNGEHLPRETSAQRVNNYIDQFRHPFTGNPDYGNRAHPTQVFRENSPTPDRAAVHVLVAPSVARHDRHHAELTFWKHGVKDDGTIFTTLVPREAAHAFADALAAHTERHPWREAQNRGFRDHLYAATAARDAEHGGNVTPERYAKAVASLLVAPSR